jgi:hypothetical protein
MSADTLDWPTMVLGNTEAEFEVLSPPALVDHLRDRSERFARAAAGRSPHH